MDRTVTAAGRALVGAMASVSWQRVYEAVTGLWLRAHMLPEAGSVGAELDELRQRVLQARRAGDVDTEKALEGFWQIKLQELLDTDPALAGELERVLETVLLPALWFLPGNAQQGDTTSSDRLAVRTAVIGQAAAALTAAAAIIYGSGALTIALRLYFTHLSWETVLGQLPRDFILTTGFGQIILPAMIIGMLGAVFLNFLINGVHGPCVACVQLKLQRYLTAEPSLRHFVLWLGTAVAVGVAEAVVSLPYYLYHAHRYKTGVVIPPFDGMFAAATLSTLAVGVALILLPAPTREGWRPELAAPGNGGAITAELDAAREEHARPTDAARRSRLWCRKRAKRRERVKSSIRLSVKSSSLGAAGWMVWVGALVGFAAIPGIATFAAVTLFPDSLACSSAFMNGQLEGNLIATSGGWAYMVEYRTENASHDFIAVVPMSSLQLETIGRYGDCAVLTSNPASPSASPSPSPSRADVTVAPPR